MKKLLEYSLPILKILMFWLLVFHAMRILFIFHNVEKVQAIGWWEVSQAFIYSFYLDVSASAILSILPFLLFTFWKIVPNKVTKNLLLVVFTVEVLAVLFIHAGEINTYPEWNHKLSSRVFMHLANPDEVGRTASKTMIFWFLFYTILGGVFAFFLSKRLFAKMLKFPENGTWKTKLTSFAVFLFFAPFLVLFARGGLQPIPINIDAAYYSKVSLANDLSVNSTYYFGKSFLLYNRSNLDEVFPKMDSTLAAKVVADLYKTDNNSFPQIFTTKRPNIVLIVLEGWSANAMKSITGQGGVTPYFDQLAKESLLFSKCYANGGTSEIGNACIFGAYPALPEISMSMQPEKHRKLPTFNEDLKKWGYYSSYRFSGDLKYGNIGSFFTDHGFDAVKDEKDFPATAKKGKLNFYDEELYKLLKQDINNTKEPFLHCAFTGSTHSPYDFPKRKNQTYKGAEEDYMNSMIYADEELHTFLESAKKEKWYKNTLFVLVADHGHTTPVNSDPNQGVYFHIPLLFFGDVLKPEWKGKINETICNQHDLVGTLLAQMNGDLSRYPWSKNVLNPTVKSFALHTVTRGYGWVNQYGDFSYNLDLKNNINQNMAPEKMRKASEDCKGFLVELYKNFKAL